MSKSGSALQSKFSVRLLCAARRSGDVDQVLQSIVQTLRDSGSGVPLLACLSAIKELFKQNAKEIQQHADELLDLIDSEVLQTSDPVSHLRRSKPDARFRCSSRHASDH
jgi:hypothetical protein